MPGAWTRAFCAAALCGAAALASARAGAPTEEPAATRVALAGGLTAEFDASARLTIKKEKTVLLTGGLLLLGKGRRAGQSGLAVEALPGSGALAAWSLGGPGAPGNLRGRLRALKAGGALALACEVNFRDLDDLAGWGYFLKLPAAGHAGARLRLGGKSVPLPARAAGRKQSELFRGRVRSVDFLRGKEVYLRILRDLPATAVVRDLRADGGKGFGLLLTGEPADLAGRARGRFCLAFSGGPGPVEPLVYHAELWPPVRPGAPVRAEIGVLAEHRSPFDPEEVAVDALVTPPEGPGYRQPAFYAREFTSRVEKVEPKKTAVGAEPSMTPEKVEVERLEPAAQPGWRAMIDAHAAGLYRVAVEVKTPAGTSRAEAKPLRLVRAAGRRMGPLAKSGKDSRYLVDPRGRAVFLLGHNLGWLVNSAGPLGNEHWRAALERMKLAGLNYARVWTCTWSLGLEGERPYSYDLGSAWKLDRVLELAAERGIHVQLCLDNFHDFRFKRDKSPFFAGPEPVCKTSKEFFTSPKARRMYSARLRYLVARYGHFENLMAWELWNELDYCIEKNERPEELAAAREEYLVPWVRSKARELAALDRRRRMVTCSLADGTIWPEMSGAPEIGLAESHVYLYMPDRERKTPAYPARIALAEASGEFAKYRKPGFVSEFGFGASGGPESPINRTDRLGVHLHNGLWISALSGHCGATALWWWDSYLAPPGDPARARTEITGEDRYWHYRALARYLEGTDWLAGWRKLTVSPPEARGPHPLITGLRTDRRVMAWLADPENTWYNRAVKGRKPAKIEKFSFGIDGLVPGGYLVEWWDAYSGRVRTSSRQTTDAAGSLRLEAPSFTRDLAVKVRLLERRRGAPAAEE